MTSAALFRREALDHRRFADRSGVPLPPAPPAAWLIWGMVACVVASLAFLALGEYARKERVSGYLAPALGIARIVARESALIASVHVHDGDLVAEGAALVTLRMGALDGGGLDVDAAVLRALGAQRDRIAEQVDAERARLARERSRLADHRAGLSDELAALQVQAGLQARRTGLTVQQVDAARGLVATGNFSRIEFQHREDAVLEQQQAQAGLARDIAARRSDILADDHALTALPDDVAARVAALRAQAAEIETRIAQTEGQAASLLRAPIAGRVTALQARAGERADPAIPLLAIVPEGDALRADLLIPARAIGEVRPGQLVRVAYDAFPATRFGLSRGRVATVSHTLLRPSEIAGPVAASGPCYRVTVLLDAQTIRAGDTMLRLAPDMTLSADIVIDRRSLLGWLLAPLRDAAGPRA